MTTRSVTWVGGVLLALAMGCTTGGGDAGLAPAKGDTRQGKADGVDLCALYQLPAGCDLCDAFGWYGDGECDEALIAAGVCHEPDPDCGGACFAVFRWLQKDAYKESAGRSSAAWPAHTTTTLDTYCQGEDGAREELASTFMANHGTAPSKVDAEGNTILEEMKRSEPIPASRETLGELVAAFEQCECAPATDFLSLDALQDTLVQEILGELTAYVEAHLRCSGAVTTDGVVALISALDLDGVFAAVTSCSWESGSGWVEAFTTAAQTVLPALDEYHVCNNDAILQTALWDEFATSGTVRHCDNTVAACHGPTFFFTP